MQFEPGQQVEAPGEQGRPIVEHLAAMPTASAACVTVELVCADARGASRRSTRLAGTAGWAEIDNKPQAANKTKQIAIL
jgi:hypothetical protein